MTTHLKIQGLGSEGMQIISLPSLTSTTTLNHLFKKIEEISSIPTTQQILFTSGKSLTYEDRTVTLHSCNIRHGSDLNFVRNFNTRSYPTLNIRLRIYRTKFLKYFSGVVATLSTFAFLSRMFVGSETMTEMYPYPFDLLAWWPASYLLGLTATCSIVYDFGHWIAGFPILPAALFTLINKGNKQIQNPAMNEFQTLNFLELKLVQQLSKYLPQLVKESTSMLDRNEKAVKNIHRNYGGTRMRFVCSDGIALDGMHIRPSNNGTKGEEEKCYIVVNGNAEFYEIDGLYPRRDSSCARYSSLGFHVLSFNYRGVGISQGTPSRDGLLLDLYSLVDYATAPIVQGGLNIDPSNVIVCGRSLGGAVSTCLLSEIVHTMPSLILCNTRSFSTLGLAASKLLGQQYGERVGKMAAYGIYGLDWELDSLKAWNNLENISGNNGYRWIETVGDDDIILPGAKLIDGLTGRSDIRVIHLDHGDASGHNRALKNSEYQKRYVFIQEGLKFNSGEESERKKTN